VNGRPFPSEPDFVFSGGMDNRPGNGRQGAFETVVMQTGLFS